MPGRHRCPGPGCRATVPDNLLMCRTHWYQVPRELRSAVWAAYGDGRGTGTPELLEAQQAAIAALPG